LFRTLAYAFLLVGVNSGINSTKKTFAFWHAFNRIANAVIESEFITAISELAYVQGGGPSVFACGDALVIIDGVLFVVKSECGALLRGISLTAEHEAVVCDVDSEERGCSGTGVQAGSDSGSSASGDGVELFIAGDAGLGSGISELLSWEV
jgi:hypothetical protein